MAQLTRQIRVETMLLRVGRDGAKTIASNLNRRREPGGPVPVAPAETINAQASRAGFLTDVNTAH